MVPLHSFKFLAALQHVQGGSAPVFGRIEVNSGHGLGRPTAKRIAEVTDQWAFLVRALKLDPCRFSWRRSPEVSTHPPGTAA